MAVRKAKSGDIATGQIVGERERQEDALATAQLRGATNALALVLADGMGGHAGGDVAAGLATKAFLSHLKSQPIPPSRALMGALLAANDQIRDAIEGDDALEGMGCTLVAATITDGRLRWISVGDSPLYLLREGRLTRLNADHSMRSVFADLVASGRLNAGDAARDPTRNALRSAVSGEEIDLIDAPDTDLPLAPGDLVLLTSDGVDTLDMSEIAETASRALRGGARRVVDDLLEAVQAKAQRHQDNASAVAYLHAGARAAPARSRPWRLPVLLALVAALALGGWAVWLSVRTPSRPANAAEILHLTVKASRRTHAVAPRASLPPPPAAKTEPSTGDHATLQKPLPPGAVQPPQTTLPEPAGSANREHDHATPP